MKRFIVTEDEKRSIRNLYEQQTNSSISIPKQQSVSANTVTDKDLTGETSLVFSWVKNWARDFNDFGVIDTLKKKGSDLIFNGESFGDIVQGRRSGVKGVVDALDGWVDENDLLYVLGIVSGLKGKCYLDDTKTPAVKKPAIERFLELYLEDERKNLIDDVNSVGTRTMKLGAEKLKKQIINTITTLRSEKCLTT